MLTKIDWYGDTWFNYLQVRRFLEEWDEMGKSANSSEQITLIEGVRRLAVQCQKDRGLLRFIGD